MRLHRFYTEEKLGDEITLRDGDAIHQIRDVFRLGAGDQVIFFNGDGSDYIYEATIVSKKEASFEFKSKSPNITLDKKVTLYMSLIKKDNFELVLEKCTEVGVTHFVPVITERTQLKNLNVERANKLLKEASEQCGRGDVPTIGEVIDLKDVLKENPDIIIFDMDGEDLKAVSSKSEVKILIGPEGGWSDSEIQKFKDSEIGIYKLGNTVLRAETAAIVAAAKIMSV